MSERIPIALPELGDEEVAAVTRVLRSGWVTQGPEVRAFEEEFAAYVGAEHAVAVSNCTTGLHLALLAVGVGPGDEVIVPTHTFVATANAVTHCGATPVFADVELETFNLDPDDVAGRITPRTKAILAVHQLGLPCDLARLGELARTRGLVLLEDAACAVGSEVDLGQGWERIGTPHGRIAAFSFHPRKIVTTGDGGMLTFQRAEDAERCRRMRHQGMSVSDTARHAASDVIFESYHAPGFNYRLTDLQAAVGRVQLAGLPRRIARRRELIARYRELLGGAPELALPQEPSWARTNGQSFCVRLTPACRHEQRAVMQGLLDRGVSTRRGVHCCHLEPAYAGGERPDLARSVEARDRGIMLPIYAALSDAEVERVARTLLEVVG